MKYAMNPKGMKGMHGDMEAYQSNSKGGSKTAPVKTTKSTSYKGQNRKMRETDAP